MSRLGVENPRTEKKGTIPFHYLNQLHNVLSVSKLGFRKAYEDRQINNIYFDSYDFIAARENLAGIARRRKFRYRWYGQRFESLDGALEIKNKSADKVWKEVYPLPLTIDHQHKWKDIAKQIAVQLPLNTRIRFQQHPCPVFINHYQRSYLVSQNGSIRVTIDQNHFVFDQLSKPTFSLLHGVRVSNEIIVEVKAPTELQEDVTKLFNALPMRLSRSSKYLAGLGALGYSY